MNYILKQYDIPLLKFSATNDSRNPEVDIIWISEVHRHLLPLDMYLTPNGVSHWLSKRIMPRHRENTDAVLSKCGLSANRPMGILAVSKGLSVDDCYWVVEEDFEGKFDDYNLYENRFTNILALIAFTGYGSSIRSSLISSPEFTTNGMLPKCWRRVGGKIKLYKGSTSGASNTGFEPYSEYYAAQIARAMGIDAIDYNLSKWKGVLCSTCELFTDKEHSFLPVGRLVKDGGFKAVFEYYQQLGDEYVNALCDMLVFDAIICNTDRHYGNFGFIVDNRTNQLLRPAPLFDHGNSLFNMAGSSVWESKTALQEYADTLQPCNYDDFIRTAKQYMTEKNREQLRHLLTFSFKRHSRYNLPKKRLKLIEDQVRERARLLLD